MSYKLACTTTTPVTAIAVGSGNMAGTLQNSSSAAPKIPVMHFHAQPTILFLMVAFRLLFRQLTQQFDGG